MIKLIILIYYTNSHMHVIIIKKMFVLTFKCTHSVDLKFKTLNEKMSNM